MNHHFSTLNKITTKIMEEKCFDLKNAQTGVFVISKYFARYVQKYVLLHTVRYCVNGNRKSQ